MIVQDMCMHSFLDVDCLSVNNVMYAFSILPIKILQKHNTVHVEQKYLTRFYCLMVNLKSEMQLTINYSNVC